jgi:hypothetical protein
MTSATQHPNTEKLINTTPAPLNQNYNKGFTKPIVTSSVKETNLERLLASCCDCV